MRGNAGFKARIRKNKVEVLYGGRAVCYWDKRTLKEAFEKKLPRLFYIKADSRGKGKDEEFWFNEAWLLKGFSFRNFTRLLKKDKVKIDIRIGQNPDGSGHDHGTGFRVFEASFDLCFAYRNQVV